ncbi:DUF418 domain-containing protein [Porphyrobacter sp. GA68]|uniref:DUF418 domain-containing protein n=1 Tax=Porphyrobacter sp. GA68 TaxID=2883480 RepID=UPI001D17F054|nr:DUF418 domain-containing protein [Porphyrobacter sp. GA68]
MGSATTIDRDGPAQSRIDSLDAARGLAVCGIVLLNIYNFSMPPAAYFNPLAYGYTGPETMVIWAIESILAQDAFRAVFAVLFGAGVAILFERGTTLRGHLARMLVLLIIGYLHAVLLNNGDVLRLYALTGLLLPLLLRLSQRGLLVAIGLLAALHLGGLGWFMWGWLRYWWDVQHGMGDPAALAMWQAEFGAEPISLERGLAEGRETLGERIARRAFNWQGPLVIFLVFLPQTLAAMLLGVWSWRSGLLRGDWDMLRSRRFALRMALIALPPMIALCFAAFWSGFAGPVVGTTALVWSQPFAIMLGLAYIAALFALCGARSLRTGLGGRLAAAGRLSLTNYVGASVVMGALFHSWGLGWFGSVSRVEATLIALGVIALILTVSPLWISRIGGGPFERLWRAGTRILA